MATVKPDQIMNKDQTPRQFIIIKTGLDVKTATDYSRIFNTRVNERVYLNVIEMDQQESSPYKAFFSYEDLFSKYVLLKPLKEVPDSDNSVDEIIERLVEIFSLIGVPKILENSNGPSFVENFARKIRKRVPILRIAYGVILNRKYSCRDFKKLLESWQKQNPTRSWHDGLYFVQINENTSKSDSQSKKSRESPAEIFFQRNIANDLIRFIDNYKAVKDIEKKKRPKKNTENNSNLKINHTKTNQTKNSSNLKINLTETNQTHNNEENMIISCIKTEIEISEDENHVDFPKEINNDAKNYHECPVCSKRFKFRQSMKRHMPIHTGKRPYECDTCGKKYTLAYSLRRHVFAVHKSERALKCDYCDKRFRQLSELTSHKIVHNEERPFQCHVCGKRFKRSKDFRTHLVIHSNVKSFECDICKRGFKLKQNLRDHIVFVHTIERPFACCFCSKRFKRVDHLKVHMSFH